MPIKVTRRVIFDMDGTLVDTRQAVYKAYELAGIRMPEDAWGKRKEDWLPKELWHFHTKKNEIYPKVLKMLGRTMPLFQFALINRCPVITGASYAATQAISETFKVHGRRLNIEAYGLSLEQKIRYLRGRRFRVEPWTYVDDDPGARAEIAKETGCQAISPEEALIVLSSLPARTRA